jgi:hypothetical protein
MSTREKKASSSFFEKKEPKKLLLAWRPLHDNARHHKHALGPQTAAPLRKPGQMDKSFFGSFFSKKELLAFLGFVA